MRRPQKRSKQKPKAVLAAAGSISPDELERMETNCSYCPSHYHKSRPGSSGLQEAPKPIPGKTICDAPGSADCLNATDLPKSGFQLGMVGEQRRNNWPQNVWAVDGDSVVYEAQLSNKERGQYHGYPMKRGDSFADYIGNEWKRRT